MNLFKKLKQLFKSKPQPVVNDIAMLKGKLGEAVVAKILGPSRPEYNYYVFNGFCFWNKDRTVQIDHIVLDRYGIHVFETKNYSGIITGGEYDTEWTQKLEGYEGKFYNPVKQNLGHIYALKNQLKLNVYCFSYIVFTGDSVIKTNTSTPVITPNKIKNTMSTNTYNRAPLTDKMIKKLYNKLNKINTVTQEEHIKNVQKRKKIKCKNK